MEEVFIDVLASVTCNSGSSQAPEIRLGLFEDPEPFYEVHSHSVQAWNVAVDSGRELCANNEPGEGSWNYDGLSFPGGRLVCYHDEDGDPWIEWTHDAQRIYAFAYRSDGNIAALFRCRQSV